MTRLRVFALALVALTALPPNAGAEPSSGGAVCPAKVSDTKGGWRRIAAPAFAAGGTSITAYAVGSASRATLLATNGDAISRTTDGGCTWKSVFVVPETPSAEFPMTRETATIVDLVAAKDRSYAVVADATGPRVLVSEDGGGSWTTTAPAFHADLTDPPRLVADASGMTAYLLVHAAPRLGIGPGDTLFATEDGGASWVPRPVDLQGGGPAHVQLEDVAVDPQAGTDVWVATTQGLYRSIDGGASWSYASPDGAGSLARVTVSHRANDFVQVIATSAVEQVVYLQEADGDWLTVNTPGVVTSAAGGRTASQAAIATDSGVYELVHDKLTWSQIHAGAPDLGELSTDATSAPAFFACVCGEANSSIWSRTPRAYGRARKPDGNRGVDVPGPGDFPGYYGCAPDPKRKADPAQFGPSTITTETDEILITPEKPLTMPVKFRVEPRPLEVFFLLDSGPRSGYFGCAAKQGAVWASEQLSRSRNLRAGAGEYRDFPGGLNPYVALNNCPLEIAKDFVYRRNVRVGPVDDAFRRGVSNITTGNCTGDFAGLAALVQAATGAGHDVLPAGPSPYDIRRRQQAGFTPEAEKVVVHVSGGWLESPERTEGYPGPTFDQAREALRKRGIKQLGVYAVVDHKKHHGGERVREYPGADDLRRVATDTGALATEAVDCGSRLKVRLRPGEPLVCVYLDEPDPTAKNVPPMGRQMMNLLGSLHDEQPMRLTVLDGDARIARIAPAGVRRRDYLVGQTLTYSVTFSCRPEELGLVKQVRLGGLVGAQAVATRTATVRCGTPPVPPPVQDIPPRVIIAPVAPAAAPAANPILQPNPATNPASQAQAQGQHAAQGAAVPQEETQPRLAYVEAKSPETEAGPVYEMSGLPDSSSGPVPAWVLVNTAALMACGAGAVAYRRRTATAPAPAWARVRRDG